MQVITMMSCRKIILSRNVTTARRVLAAYCTKAESLEKITYNRHLPKRLEIKPAKKPFAKNLLVGEFDFDILAFPEAQDSERNRAFFKWLKPVEDFIKTVDAKAIDKNKNISDDIIDTLNKLEVFSACIEEDYGGLGFLESEYMKLLETLAKIPALALFVVQINKCVKLINKYGSVAQKLEYLPKIADGSIIPTCCLSEPKIGDPKQIRTQSYFSSDSGYWIVSGEKIFVPYADKANIFLTFANCNYSNDCYAMDKTLSLILIEKNRSNIIISEPIETVGLKGLKYFNVTFKDTEIPEENIIGGIGQGFQMYTEFLSSRKHDTGAIAIGIMKTFIEILTFYMTHTKHFNKNLFEFDTAKEVLGKACHTLYGMESATYLATALMDLHKDQDCTMESGIIQNYCSYQCKHHISEGIHLIGTPAYLSENLYDLYFRDAHALTVFDTSVIDNETYVALIGLQHAGKLIGDHVKKLRISSLMNMFSFSEKHLNIKIEYHLHPTLEHCANQLNVILYKLKEITYDLLVTHGADISDNHMDLRRYYEIASIAYVYSSILARASRAYCIGLRNAEQDIQMAFTYSYLMTERVKFLFNEFQLKSFKNGDKNYKEIAQKTLEKKEYLAEHPLIRNF